MPRNLTLLSCVTDKERTILEKKKASLLVQFEEMECEEEASNRRLFYENQRKTASEVVENIMFNTLMVFHAIIAPMQSGKTGCMLAIIKSLLTTANTGNSMEQVVNPRHIYVISGVNDAAWKEQTRNRMPPSLKDNVYHRGDFKRLHKTLKDKKNVLIMVDEAHIACKAKMSMGKLLQEIGYKDFSSLEENNVSFVLISATLNAIKKDINSWPPGTRHKYVMQPSASYKGIKDLLSVAKEYRQLGCDYTSSIAAIKEIRSVIQTRYGRDILKPTHPKFHLIRCPCGGDFSVVVDRFRTAFQDLWEAHGSDAFVECTSQTNADESLLEKLSGPKPNHHVFIFIKEKARIGATLPKMNLGVLYERKPKNSATGDVIVQGLAGRWCGYDHSESWQTTGPIVFTDIQSLTNYVKDEDSDFETTNTTYRGMGNRRAQPTIMHPTTFVNNPHPFVEEQTEQVGNTISPDSYRIYDTLEKVQEARKIMGGKTKVVRPRENDDGFYTVSVASQKARVWELNECIRQGVPKATQSFINTKDGVKKQSERVHYPCYVNVQDKSTLRFVYIVYRREDLTIDEHQAKIKSLDANIQPIPHHTTS